jgi:hypothetical protein
MNFGMKELAMKKIWIGLLVAVGLLTAAFFLLNFRWMTSQSNSQSAVATGGKKSFQEQGKFAPDATGLYVEGSCPFIAAFQEQLQKSIEHQVYVGEVTAINLPANQVGLPAIFVEIIPVHYAWTPIAASAEYKIVVTYASNGDVSFRNQPVVHFQMGPGEPALQFSATLTWSDESRGLISARGYQQYLSERWVQAIQEILQKQIEG